MLQSFHMSRLLSILILISSIFSFAFPSPVHAQTCSISEAHFLNKVGNHVTLIITPSGDCAGWQGNINLKEVDSYFDDTITSDFSFSFTNGSTTNIDLIVGEQECDSGEIPDCEVGADISIYRILPQGQTNGPDYDLSDTAKTLRYDCATTNNCTNNIPWGIGTPSADQECTVTKAIWNPAGYKPDLIKNAPNHNAVVQVMIDSYGCAGKTYYLDIVNQTQTPDAVALHVTVHVQSNQATSTSLLNFNVGEETCTPADLDCVYFLKTSYQPPNGTLKEYSSENESAGTLRTKCFEACDMAWSSASLGTPVTDPDHVTQAESIPPVQPNTVTVAQTPNPSGIDPNCEGKPTCYSLDSGLAEILKMKTIDTSSLGGFINSIIAFGIGIAGIITVVMIMYDGFSYWSAGNDGNEAKMGKVKGRIWKRLLGLVLLLTVYTILRTINPDLLQIVPDFAGTLFKIEDSSPVDPNSQSTDEQPRHIVTGGSGSYATDPQSNISQYDSFFKASAIPKGVDCDLMKADMYIESMGNPNAVSSAGARGLMQLMPAVAQTFHVNFDTVFDPKINIETSSKLWQYNYKAACNGHKSNSVCNVNDIKYIIAANSAGPGANKPSTTCPGKTIWECESNAGYKETREYIPKVTHAYSILQQNGWGCPQ